MEFNSIQDFKSNYIQVYHKEVLPSIEKYEQERKKTKIIYLVTKTFGVIATIIVVLSFFNSYVYKLFFVKNKTFLSFIYFILFILGPLALVLSSKIDKNFENKFKKSIMPHLMKAFGDFQWTDSSVIDYFTIKLTTLFPRFNEKSDDDNFYGTYKGLGVNISETKLTYSLQTSKSSNTNDNIEFKGVIIEIDVKKPFKGHTIIRKREFINNNRAYQEIKLEDTEFTKQYYVDSNDQIESRYILTPSFIERFKNLKQAFGGNSIQASFQNDKLIMAISMQKDIFKLADLSKPIADSKQFTKLLDEFSSILEIIDELKLNQNIGL